ncbi:hypothetical protein BI49514_02523 [Brevibacterium iodinum ATCC 49514]|uniref:DUF4129 domain-containing protein n=1 Tax=Brevibacterium iodinum ATCC 49514 TaxID=1255616 RepID=A0A2H1JYZ8_9MICO|nr:hypothetical protein [Brevibacterium iodinum]SMX92689.1 hypothetical protein BI49514_02523 [Brevibacterium iodinum ATCC 49514]SUW13235.1 Uncharacterised protein [Brevibacterium iodinum]
MGPAELIGPLEVSPAWYVAACFVLLLACGNLFAPLFRAAAGVTSADGPRIPIPVRSTYLSRISAVETGLTAEWADVRESAQQLATIVREFAHDAWGVKAEHLTYRDAAVAGLDDLAQCLLGLYEAEFAEAEPAGLQPQIAEARTLVARWS